MQNSKNILMMNLMARLDPNTNAGEEPGTLKCYKIILNRKIQPQPSVIFGCISSVITGMMVPVPGLSLSSGSTL